MSRGHQVQVTLFAWSYAEIYIYIMCILNRSALGQLNWLTTATASPRTSQRGEAPMGPNRRNQTSSNALWQSVLRVSFEACFVDLGWLEKHNFQQCCWQQKASRHSVFSVNSHKASPLGPVSGLAVVVPSQCWTVSKSYYLQLRQNWLLLQVTE